MNYKSISVSQLVAMMNDPELLIVDIRDKRSFINEHIPSAQTMTPQLLSQIIRGKIKNRPVVVYCYHGISSQEVCRMLASSGIGRVYNLEGGWQAWSMAQQKQDTGVTATLASLDAAWA